MLEQMAELLDAACGHWEIDEKAVAPARFCITLRTDIELGPGVRRIIAEIVEHHSPASFLVEVNYERMVCA